MPLKRIPEDDIKSLNGIDYTEYFELDLDFSKLKPKDAMTIKRSLDNTKKEFKEFLEEKRTVGEETSEAVSRRSKINRLYNTFTMKAGKRTRQKRKGKRTRRK
jgi:hypothetical protein